MGFFTGLTKVIHAGNAYMEHVQFVETAQQTQPRELAGLLTQYVQGLSQASFTGFKMTLGMLAGKEQNAQRKEFIQSLLEYADVARSGNVAPAVIDETAASSTVEESVFDRDVTLVEKWYALNGYDQRVDAVKKHVLGMTSDELTRFTINLKQMRENVIYRKKEHENNEDNAWGGFIEDRMSYQLARLRTGQRDPDFVRRLEEFQDYLNFIEWLIQKTEM
jgi:hypothetical protein